MYVPCDWYLFRPLMSCVKDCMFSWLQTLPVWHNRLSLMIPRLHPHPPPARYPSLGCCVESFTEGHMKCEVWSLDTPLFRRSPSEVIPFPEGQADKGVSQQLKMPPLHQGPTQSQWRPACQKCEGPSNSTVHPTETPVDYPAACRPVILGKSQPT
jgi:hypothetical protein